MMLERRWCARSAIDESVLEALQEKFGYETTGSRIRALEARVAELSRLEKAHADLCEQATVKLNRGQPVSRKEAAVFLGWSEKSLQRLEAARGIQRCSRKFAPLRYAASDVLRLASAPRRER